MGPMEPTSPPEDHPGGSFPRIGAWAWSFVGVAVATIIVVTALAAVSEIALPLLFAAVLAVIFKPVAGSLERHRFKPSLAAGVLVLGLLLLMTVVMTATVRGVLDQTDEIGASVDAAKEYAVVENFIGGYIPYIGAFIGGGLAVIVALGDGGLGVAAVMLAVVLASNLLLENFVEPKVMGRTLNIHPQVVLVVTALGGFLAGIVGLILAVPFTVIAGNAIGRLRSHGFFNAVADRAPPAVQTMLD